MSEMSLEFEYVSYALPLPFTLRFGTLVAGLWSNSRRSQQEDRSLRKMDLITSKLQS